MADPFARHLRKNMTDAERYLWYRLRGRQIAGQRFRRQFPIGSFIVDSVCLEQKLIIELDGGQHAERTESDEARTAWLNAQGFRVLRFWNNLVFEETEGVLEAIANSMVSPVATPNNPHPNPPRKGGGNQKAHDESVLSPPPLRGRVRVGGDEQSRRLFSCPLPPCGGGLGWGVRCVARSARHAPRTSHSCPPP